MAYSHVFNYINGIFLCAFFVLSSTSVLINMYKSEQVVSLSLFFYNNKKKQQHKVAKQMDKKKIFDSN